MPRRIFKAGPPHRAWPSYRLSKSIVNLVEQADDGNDARPSRHHLNHLTNLCGNDLGASVSTEERETLGAAFSNNIHTYLQERPRPTSAPQQPLRSAEVLDASLRPEPKTIHRSTNSLGRGGRTLPLLPWMIYKRPK
jgi:hypothetical protein